MKKYKNDLILFGALLMFFFAVTIWNLFTAKPGGFVEVKVDGELITSFPLSSNIEYEINGINNGKNILIVRDGEAWIESASCPDGLCVNMGHIRNTGASVICLPNKVVIEIVGDATDDASVDIEVGQ